MYVCQAFSYFSRGQGHRYNARRPPMCEIDQCTKPGDNTRTKQNQSAFGASVNLGADVFREAVKKTLSSGLGRLCEASRLRRGSSRPEIPIEAL